MSYIESANKQFIYYKHLGDECLIRLSQEQLLWKPDKASNSVAIIINHLNGNMVSRWTDFLHSDGEKSYRQRDSEFEEIIKTKEQVIEKWEGGWQCLFNALEPLDDSMIENVVYIRNIGHTIYEAINRQQCHYAYHIGQMVFLSKMILKDKWTSLSIPKGKSQQYNSRKFSKKKVKGHFTDEFLQSERD